VGVTQEIEHPHIRLAEESDLPRVGAVWYDAQLEDGEL
jgi:hypothetical protein